MTTRDWLQVAKDQIYVDPDDGIAKDQVLAAALIAIAEELRRANDRPVIVLTIAGDELAIPDAVSIARSLQQNVEDRIEDLS